ncbi:M14 family zinc carboxypeptidase [Glaciecola siphonariae]|uniref:M14 family zinc carboxypeptidase n=1 Tax=Glaciecola siphonariae TaxID=521012 RepID=A0ABV9LW74_9ALTE
MSSSISHLLETLNLSHITHSDIQPLIHALKGDAKVSVCHQGNSFEGRSIERITFGNGPIKILAWTQMHGNEATATASVFDLLDTLLSSSDESLVDAASLFTLDIVPMLNPDGAERCIRHNAQAIDINRDAMAKQTLEGNLLMDLVDTLKPHIAFNLHDQSPYYQCGTNGNPSTIAFLAPAFDVDKTIDKPRRLAMALISHMTDVLKPHINQSVARYDDTFSPRSFGDRIAGKGAATILIESGAARNDPDRQIARRMNHIAMLAAMRMLKREHQGDIDDAQLDALQDAYWTIPENTSETLSSLLIRNLHFVGPHSYQASISIKQTARYSNQFFIDAVGDVGVQAGLEEFDAGDLTYDAGSVHTLSTTTIITEESYHDWLRQGVIQFQGPIEYLDNQSPYQVLMNQPLSAGPRALVLQQPAYFLMRRGDSVVAAVINGKLIKLT